MKAPEIFYKYISSVFKIYSPDLANFASSASRMDVQSEERPIWKGTCACGVVSSYVDQNNEDEVLIRAEDRGDLCAGREAGWVLKP